VPDRKGVLVAEVDQRAKTAGIEHGDIIIKADGRQIASVKDFEDAAKSAAGPISVTFTRDGAEHTASLDATSRR
ncbi:MAG TPA: PDZ domain-containing protein, partial [Candidatus Binataceae bacterium]